MSLIITNPDGTRPMLAARDATLARNLLDAWRMHVTARGGTFAEHAPGVWHAINARGIHYATVTLT